MSSSHRNRKALSSVAPTPKEAPKPKKPQMQRSNSPPRTPPSQPLKLKPALEQSVPAPAAPHAQPTFSSQAHANIQLPQSGNPGPSPMHMKPALAPHFTQHSPPAGAGGGEGGGATGGGPPEFSV